MQLLKKREKIIKLTWLLFFLFLLILGSNKAQKFVNKFKQFTDGMGSTL